MLAITTVVVFALNSSCKEPPKTNAVAGKDFQHVHLMHLDGFRPDVFRSLLEGGQLPHFKFLLDGVSLDGFNSGGKVSYVASTVDKSETMKVIQSYLTSRRDTEVVGWWQFSRESLAFKNFWLNPEDVIDYAVGLRFPMSANLFDFLTTRDDHNVTAGFSLHRRGVDFRNYSRNYVEGATAVFRHTYYDQTDTTMRGVLGMYRRFATSTTAERLPTLSTSLLAAADEFGHLKGVLGDKPEACINRSEEEDPYRIVFERLGDPRENHLRQHREDYFYESSESKLCFRIPEVELYADAGEGGSNAAGRARKAPVQADYVLGMMVIDMQLSRLIETLRSIHLEGERAFWKEPKRSGIQAYRQGGQKEGTLFERTLFVFTGDHGMVHTAAMVGPDNQEEPNPARNTRFSRVHTLIQYLNRKLDLETYPKTNNSIEVPDGVEIGIDNDQMPLRLQLSHLAWQSGSHEAREVAEARAWAKEYIQTVKEGLKDALYKQYWYLLLFRKLIIDPKIDADLGPIEDRIEPLLTSLYLRGRPAYMNSELRVNGEFFDRQIRLVYGGGARNNAELFIPSKSDAGWTWENRPSLQQIRNYRGGRLLEALKDHPSVGLVFIRENNADVSIDSLPDEMSIRVIDREGNEGVISVRRGKFQQLVYDYRLANGSSGDPLRLGFGARMPEQFGTYDQWNTRSVEDEVYYHNVVAGMGSYLYSSNPSIGDITITHSQGWNFGTNSGGHGGVHRGEKLTVMMVAGPGIKKGDLKSRARYVADERGEVHEAPAGLEFYPTVVDIPPTILDWLGYEELALTRFSRSQEFRDHLRDWVAEQREDIVTNLDNMPNVRRFLQEARLGHLKLSEFTPQIRTLLRFMPSELDEELYKRAKNEAKREDGNILILERAQ